MKKLEKAMHTIRLTRIGSLPSECTESRNYFDLRPVHGTSYRFERRVRRQNKPTDFLNLVFGVLFGPEFARFDVGLVQFRILLPLLWQFV